MSKNITLNDFGKLVKPKVLTEAFLLCDGGHIDIDKWWRHSNLLYRSSKSHKKSTIEGTFGVRADPLFQSLNINEFVGVINSFVVFHDSSFKLVSSENEAKTLQQTKKRTFVIAAGVTFYKNYNKETKALGEVWEYSSSSNIVWLYTPKLLIPIESVELFNSVEAGDMIVFQKSQAIVISVKTLKRQKFYETCSWTNKKITVLNGSHGKKARLVTERPYKVIKPPKN